MALNISKELAALERMTLADLRQRYAEVHGEGTSSRHKQFLIRRILWRLQANAEGDLSERARQRAKELSDHADVRLTAPQAKPLGSGTEGEARIATIQLSPDDRLPMPGAIITRRYKGRLLEVRVLPHGFEYEGEIYRTLSAVAKQVTGTHWNGYHFFKMRTKGPVHGSRKAD
jgi:hypothetical protein